MKNILLVIFIFLFISCASTKLVEVPVDKVRIEYRDRLKIDTIINTDSTIIKDKGDTVFLEKYKYIYKIKERRDTINLTDTITVVQKVEIKEEVNHLHNWQIILMIVGGSTIALGLYKLINRFKRWI